MAASGAGLLADLLISSGQIRAHFSCRRFAPLSLPSQYYEHASSLNYIPDIRTPTLFLVSEDDPFLGVLPDVECASNPSTLLAATARGGHVAFLQGLWPLGGAYMGEWGRGCGLGALHARGRGLVPEAVRR